MGQNFNTIAGSEQLKDSRPRIQENFDTLRSNFEGAGFPANPVKGQHAFVNGVWYTWNSSQWVNDGTLHAHGDIYYTKAEVDTGLATKAATVHTHDDRYYTEAEITTLLAGKAASAHIHDDRYYTETEVNTKVSTDISTHNAVTGTAHGINTSIANAIDPVQSHDSDSASFPTTGNKAGRLYFKKDTKRWYMRNAANDAWIYLFSENNPPLDKRDGGTMEVQHAETADNATNADACSGNAATATNADKLDNKHASEFAPAVLAYIQAVNGAMTWRAGSYGTTYSDYSVHSQYSQYSDTG